MTVEIEIWRKLRVGDKIRLIEFPREFLKEAYYVHRETMRVYKKLVARARPLRIFQIDEWGIPWIRCRFRLKGGRWEYHSLAVNHGGIVQVNPRQGGTGKENVYW